MKMNNTEQFARYLVHYLPENLKPERGSSLQPYMDAIEKALNSAPADGWVLVPRKPTKDMCHAGCEISVSPDVPAEIWNAMIEAAPQRGGEHE